MTVSARGRGFSLSSLVVSTAVLLIACLSLIPGPAFGEDDAVTDALTASLFGESFSSRGQDLPVGISTTSPLAGGNNFGFQTQFRPGSFNAGTRTAAQLVQSADFSGLMDSNLAFKMSAIDGSLIPFADRGPMDSFGFGAEDSFGSEIMDANTIQPGLSFYHSLSPGLSSQRLAQMALSAPKGIQSREISVTGSKFTMGFSRLSVGAVDSPELLSDVTGRINQGFASRSALGAAATPLLTLTDLRALKGIKQQDAYITFSPTKSLALGAEFNDVQTGRGDIHSEDYKIGYGAFQLLTSRRSIDATLSDAVLNGLGRADLVGLKGVKQQESHVTFTPSKLFGFGANFNEANTSTGDVHLADYKLNYGTFQFLTARRSVDAGLSDAVLKGMNRPDLLLLKGVDQQESHVSYAPTKILSFGADFNDASTSAGDVHLEDYKFNYGTFQFLTSRRSVDAGLSDTVLKGMNRPDLVLLKGVEQQQSHISYAPTKVLSFGADFNDAEMMSGGDLHLENYKVSYGRFQLLNARRSLDYRMSDTALKGMGREDLVGLKGTDATEWTAMLPLLVDPKGASKLSVTHYRKDETVDRSGDPAAISEDHARSSTVVVAPSPATTLTYTDVTTTSGNVQRPDGVELDETINRTYYVTHKFDDRTSTAITRSLTVTDKGKEGEPDLRSDSLSMHLDTKPWKQLSLSGDWSHIDDSQVGQTADSKIKVTAPLNKVLSVTADLHDKYSDSGSLEQQQSYTFSYLWNKGNKLSLTSSVNRTGLLTALSTTNSQTVGFTPWKDTTLEYTLSDTETPASPIYTQQLTLRQRLLDHLSVVARQRNSLNTQGGEQQLSTYYFDWAKEKSPYSFQLGFESLDFSLARLTGSASQGTPLEPDRNALYAKFAGSFSKTVSFGGSYSQRSDLTKTPLELWDWSLSKAFSKDWKLKASAYSNRPAPDRLDDSILPFSKTYLKLYEQSYSMDFPASVLPLLNKGFVGNLGYAMKKDLGANTVSDELSLSLSRNLTAANRLSLKFARGLGMAKGQPDEYNTFAMSYGLSLGDANEFSISGRYIDDADFAPSTEGRTRIDLTLRRMF